MPTESARADDLLEGELVLTESGNVALLESVHGTDFPVGDDRWITLSGVIVSDPSGTLAGLPWTEYYRATHIVNVVIDSEV